MKKTTKNLMCVREYRSKKTGELLSYQLYYYAKDRLTGELKLHQKSVKVPADKKGVKALEAFKHKIQSDWKEEVDNKGKGIIVVKKDDIGFYQYACQWVENLLEYNREGFNHYSGCKLNLKYFKEQLGGYLLSEITLPVVQEFCKWLVKRTYIKEKVTVIQSLDDIRESRKLSVREVADPQARQIGFDCRAHGQGVRKQHQRPTHQGVRKAGCQSQRRPRQVLRVVFRRRERRTQKAAERTRQGFGTDQKGFERRACQAPLRYQNEAHQSRHRGAYTGVLPRRRERRGIPKAHNRRICQLHFRIRRRTQSHILQPIRQHSARLCRDVGYVKRSGAHRQRQKSSYIKWCGHPPATRTRDTVIKSHVLYRLS